MIEQYLYKYLGINGAEAVIQKNTFRWQHYSQYADMSESEHIQLPERMTKAAKYRLREWLAHSRIFCLTDKENDQRMWEEYADNQQGIMIQLNNEIFRAHFNKVGFYCRKVEYSNAKTSIIPPHFDIVARHMAQKKEHFSWESETRYISKSCIPIQSLDINISMPQTLEEREKFSVYRSIPDGAISKVTFGDKISNDLKKKLIEMLEERNIHYC